MKNLLFTGFLLTFISWSASATDITDSVRFCFRNYPVPKACTVSSATEIRSVSGNLSWVYVEKDNLLFSWNALLNKLQTYPAFSRERLRCILAGREVNGYRVSYQKEGKTMYQLIAYGIVNNQPVLVQLNTNKNPLTNKDLPDFAKQFILLTH